LTIETTVPVAAAVVLGVGILLAVLERSRHGLSTAALRSDPAAAAACAIPIRAYQIAATVLGCCIAALAGALYAHFIGFVQPDLFNFALLIGMASWVFFGGTTTFVGPAFGALALSVLPQAISGLYQYRLLAYAVLVIVVVILRPNGLITRQAVATVGRRLRALRSSSREPVRRATEAPT
jgi:branched-chain amino acid transport system permease protein